nr:choice-of-anchor E domain-containing protein [Corallincola sp.]
MFKGAVCRILSLAALMLAPSLAHAGLIQQTQSFSLSTSGNTYGYSYGGSNTNATNRSGNLLFDGFDSSLGLLTGVELSFASSFSIGGSGGASDSRPYTRYESYRVKVSDFGCGFL